MKPRQRVGLLSWANSHPIVTTLFTLLLVAAIPIGISYSRFADNPYAWAIGAGLVFVLGGPWVAVMWKHSNKIIVLTLTAVLLLPSLAKSEEPPQQENAVAIAAGVIVICGGGYCVYKMVKVCQKKFPPKDTNSAPSELTAEGNDDYGGAQEFSSIGSCYIPASPNSFPYEDLFHNPTTFTIDVSLDGGVITTRMGVNNQEGTAQTWDQFVAEMADHGLFLTGRAALAPQYERDGVPCDAADVPLSFDPLTGHVIHNTGGELRTVSVERSPNMETWYPFLATDVADGSRFRVVDTTREGQMFYRVQVRQP